jgi:hypothetical protein
MPPTDSAYLLHQKLSGQRKAAHNEAGRGSPRPFAVREDVGFSEKIG